MRDAADAAGGKTVTFALHSLQTLVFFEGAITNVGALFAAGLEIDGYLPTRDEDGGGNSGAISGLQRDPEYAGPRYFVPESPQPELSIMNIGQMANDLAIGPAELSGAGDGGYAARSAASNALALVQRLERTPDEPSRLRPSRPISTLARTVIFANELPMELGCECARHGDGRTSVDIRHHCPKLAVRTDHVRSCSLLARVFADGAAYWGDA